MEKTTMNVDPESGREGISHWKLIFDQGVITHDVASYDYEGSGTEDDPYVVEWLENDKRNPMTWSTTKKWVSCICMAFAVLVVSFCSSAFAGGMHIVLCTIETARQLTRCRCSADPYGV
jgi:hypothetical protein